MKDGLVKLLRKDSIKHGINVTINDNKIALDFHVIVVIWRQYFRGGR